MKLSEHLARSKNEYSKILNDKKQMEQIRKKMAKIANNCKNELVDKFEGMLINAGLNTRNMVNSRKRRLEGYRTVKTGFLSSEKKLEASLECGDYYQFLRDGCISFNVRIGYGIAYIFFISMKSDWKIGKGYAPNGGYDEHITFYSVTQTNDFDSNDNLITRYHNLHKHKSIDDFINYIK